MRGLALVGAAVDTGRPIPQAKIRADNYEARNTRFSEVETDSKGRFVFFNLERRIYRLTIEGTVHPDVNIVKLADGRYSYESSGNPHWEILGGESAPTAN